MRDPVIERLGRYVRDHGTRCPVCRCIPRARWAHEVSVEARARTGFEMFTTCDSHYCRSKDPA